MVFVAAICAWIKNDRAGEEREAKTGEKDEKKINDIRFQSTWENKAMIRCNFFFELLLVCKKRKTKKNNNKHII